jgi:hypothetical protein
MKLPIACRVTVDARNAAVPVEKERKVKLVRRFSIMVLACGAFALSMSTAAAQNHRDAASSPSTAAGDPRQLVEFPEPMRAHTLANMRDHLLTLQEINLALSQGADDKAARVAEQRLGLSSLEAHGAAHLAQFMPQPMQDIGTAMHRAASRFAVEAQNASATNDLRPALAALGAVMQQCVACHAAYRLR